MDDLILQPDCDRSQPPQPGWYRIVGDDLRLMHIVSCLSDAELPLAGCCNP